MDFKNNYKLYEKENENTVDILFGLTDFTKFKGQILEVKRGDIKVVQEKVDLTISGIKDESFFWDLYNEDTSDKSKKWQKKLEHHDKKFDVSLFSRP